MAAPCRHLGRCALEEKLGVDIIHPCISLMCRDTTTPNSSMTAIFSDQSDEGQASIKGEEAGVFPSDSCTCRMVVTSHRLSMLESGKRGSTYPSHCRGVIRPAEYSPSRKKEMCSSWPPEPRQPDLQLSSPNPNACLVHFEIRNGRRRQRRC